MSCSHNSGLFFDRVEIKAGDLISHVHCRQCGTSGSYTLDTDDVMWPEDEDAFLAEGDCHESCAVHLSDCDGNCDHLEGHKNACVELQRIPPGNPGAGGINNCHLRNTGAEEDSNHGPCAICGGTCPDREEIIND